MEDFQKQVDDLKQQVEALKKGSSKDKISIVVFSGSLDKILAAFVIATGATAMGTEVSLFFTFWGTSALRSPTKKISGKDIISRMFGFMLPNGFKQLKLSQMHLAGMGTTMMKNLMKKKNVASLEEMLELAEEFDVKITICEMSMDLMGLQREEMIDYKNLRFGGVATFLADAYESKFTLFI